MESNKGVVIAPLLLSLYTCETPLSGGLLLSQFWTKNSDKNSYKTLVFKVGQFTLRVIS
jgi:hypothetical protein